MRLFVALWPPDSVLEAVRALPRPAVPGVRWTAPDQLHVTLRFLGESSVEDVAAALSSVAWSPAPVAVLGSTVGRFGREVLHVPVEGLSGLAGVVTEATASLGKPPPDRPFFGHLTLARARRGAHVRPLAGASLGAPRPWTVGEVTLVASRLHSAGARYEVVERWVLEPNIRS